MGGWLRNTIGGPGALRLILALAVFAHHISSAGIGFAAVYIFFALSGFWIYRMWSAKYEASGTPVLTYYISRYWRLAPLFVLAGIVTAIGYRLLGRAVEWTPATVISSVTILGYASLPVRPVGPAWSLDIEAQFYLLAPALIWLIRRAPTGPVLAGAALLSALGAILGLKATLLPYLLFFVLGIAAAHVDWRPARLSVWMPLAAMGALTILLLLSPWRSVVVAGAHPGPWFAWNEPYNVGFGLAVIPYAISTTARRGGRHDSMFADLSFAVYLLHWVAAQWLAQIGAGHSFAGRVPFAIVAVLATLAASWLAWIAVDRPLNRMRAAWVRRRAWAPSAVGPVPAE